MRLMVPVRLKQRVLQRRDVLVRLSGVQRQVGMVHEVLTQYGPVNRFWFDGTKSVPAGTNMTDLWQRVYHEIRTT